MISLSVLFYSFLLLFNSVSSSTIPTKVLAAVEIMRHGARAPCVNYSESKTLLFGTKRSQLTFNGFRQHLLLGRYMRRKFILGDVYKLLDETKIGKELKVFSSPKQRTIFSAASHILGMSSQAVVKVNFQGNEEMKTNDVPPMKGFHLKRRFQEVTIDVISPNDDKMFHAVKCRRKGMNISIKQSVLADFDSEKHIFTIERPELKLAIDEIWEHYGHHFHNNPPFKSEAARYTESTLRKLTDFLDQYRYHVLNDLDLSKDTIISMKKTMLNKYYNHRIVDDSISKLTVTTMYREIINLFEAAVSKKNTWKYMIFSGHDDNIMNTLANLLEKNHLKSRIYDSIKDEEEFAFVIPRLASSILIELIELSEGENYIRVTYNGHEIKSHFINPVKYHSESGLLDYKDFLKVLDLRTDPEINQLECSLKH